MMTTTQEHVNTEWNCIAGDWDDDPQVNAYSNEFFKILNGILTDKHLKTIVDFGCGTGLLTEKLRKKFPTSRIICIDTASAMIDVVQEKIQARKWNNVEAHCVIIARSEDMKPDIKQIFAELNGNVDLVVASSVMAFVPNIDLKATMKCIGNLLKTNGGLFVHSDWPPCEEVPNGFTDGKAADMYALGSLKKESTSIHNIDMDLDEDLDVKIFVGVASRSSDSHY